MRTNCYQCDTGVERTASKVSPLKNHVGLTIPCDRFCGFVAESVRFCALGILQASFLLMEGWTVKIAFLNLHKVVDSFQPFTLSRPGHGSSRDSKRTRTKNWSFFRTLATLTENPITAPRSSGNLTQKIQIPKKKQKSTRFQPSSPQSPPLKTVPNTV